MTIRIGLEIRRRRQYELIDTWTASQISSSSIETLLAKAMVRHPYPMLNRLHMLRLLIDAAVASEKPSWQEGEPRVLAHAAELITLAEQFDAPLHFTPMYLGVCCALVYLRRRDEAGQDCSRLPTEPDCEQLRQTALRALILSEETHTMRRAYYDAISELYYLYDDFNDRQIHSRAALQMAGTEVVSGLKALLEWPERAALKESPNAARSSVLPAR